jgi:hypothetical protein
MIGPDRSAARTGGKTGFCFFPAGKSKLFKENCSLQ